jgi:hypothetical protein
VTSREPLDPVELFERALADFGDAVAEGDFASAESCIRVAVAVSVVAPSVLAGARR